MHKGEPGFSLSEIEIKNKRREKKIRGGASMVAQWLKIHLPMQGTRGFEPWSGKIPHAAELSPCVTTTEPACHNY